MVHGSVWGGATDLVLSCDLIVGDETSSFAITPANLGLAYNTAGLLQFMRRLPLNLVKEMFFTAASVTASDAAKWGILNHLVPAEQLESFTLQLAQTMATIAIPRRCASSTAMVSFFGSTMNTAEGSDYDFIGGGGWLGLRQLLPGRFILDLNGLVEYDDYESRSSFAVANENGDREDIIGSAGAVLTRPITDWLSVSARYQYLNNESNTQVFDYDRHIAGAFVTIGLLR